MMHVEVKVYFFLDFGVITINISIGELAVQIFIQWNYELQGSCRCVLDIQSTPANSNLQGKSKKGSSYWDPEENSQEQAKKQFLLHSENFDHI